MNLVRLYLERVRWEKAYTRAVQIRDWQTCDILSDVRPPALPWPLETFVCLASGRRAA